MVMGRKKTFRPEQRIGARRPKPSNGKPEGATLRQNARRAITQGAPTREQASHIGKWISSPGPVAAGRKGPASVGGPKILLRPR